MGEVGTVQQTRVHDQQHAEGNNRHESPRCRERRPGQGKPEDDGKGDKQGQPQI